MSEKQYNIGEFAAINKISTRMLRHYDKIGLLHPAAIGENGYRLYSSAQISIATLIKKYRACEFSLEEIGMLLVKEGELSRLAKQKIQELHTQKTVYSDALQRLHELTGGGKTVRFHNPYELSFTARVSQQLCAGVPCGEARIEREFNDLYAFLETKDFMPDGLSTLLCDLSAEDCYRVAVPLKAAPCNTTYTSMTMEAGQYLSTFHYGDYYDIAAAYDRLILYMEQNGLNSDGIFFERYFLDSTHTAFSAEYITEVSIKITP